MLKLITTLQDWIYPPRCMSCRNLLPLQNEHGRNLWLCAYCENLFLPLEGPGCKICSVPLKTHDPITHTSDTICASCRSKTLHFSHNRSGFAYDDLIRDLLHEVKFRRRKHVAQGLGRLWASMAVQNIPEGAKLVPLPMHPKKRRARGFDQAEILTAALAAHLNTKPAAILERTQNTPPQSGLHPRQRAENVRNAFRIKPGIDVKGQSYILIDDIYTTGASLNECARILKASGAAEVSAMTLAIAIKKERNYPLKGNFAIHYFADTGLG